MSKSKFKFNLEDNSSEEENVIVKYEEKSFWDKLLDALPTPEEELETMKQDQVKLSDLIEETKEVIKKIDTTLEDKSLEDEDKNNLNQKLEYYTNMLETFESELRCTKVQEKSLDKMLKEEETGEEGAFEESLPELIANSLVTSKKKMEDVNSVVKSIEISSKKNRIEECIICEVNIKDDKGRKASIRHFHLLGYETFIKYKPVICVDCFIKKQSEGNIEAIKSIVVSEEFENDSETACKKGNKIYSEELEVEIPEFKIFAKKLIDLESKNFIESIKIEEKTSFFGFEF